MKRRLKMFSFEKLKGRLIVSCQALPDEPLHSAFIMGRMARAAKEGGACAIRARHRLRDHAAAAHHGELC